MAGSYIVNVPKLKGRENYDEWAFAAENFLMLDGVDIHKQESTDGSSVEEKKAKAKLIMTIDSSIYVHIKNEQTVQGVWKRLKSLYDDSGFTRRISLLRQLISIRLEDCESMGAYVTQIVDTAQKLKGTGFQINDEWIGSLLLTGLTERFAPMIMAIEHSGIIISTDVIKSKLLDMSSEVDSHNGTNNAFLSKGWQQRNKKSGNTDTKSKMASSTKSVKTIRCYKCKQLGHYMNKCPNNQNKSETNAFSAIFMNSAFHKSDWYVDSGASSHMTTDQSCLQNVRLNHKVKDIVVANKETVPVICSGNMMITTIVDNSEFDIIVKDVLCVPNLSTNLLSVSQLIRNGNKVNFEGEVCYIRNRQDVLIGKANLVNGVYKLDTKSESLVACSATTLTSEIWHRRLGHINSKDLNTMRNGAVEGISYIDKAEIDKSNCITCCEGKQARLPFSHKGKRCENVLEIVHADLCGPMEQVSLGQARYFLLFVEDYSRMAFVYFLKAKNQALKYFKEFKVLVETQTGKKLKTLRTDNGGEFCSAEFEDYLKKNGIVHQTTNPYTPEQNGLCERLNRTVVERARCLLFEANLEKRFWAEAINTAVYLRNRTLASGLQKTPYELWSGKKPDLSHVRIFGSPAMVHIPKIKRTKWDKKAGEYIMIGYADNTKGYRLYNPKTKSITTSRDVIVMEKIKNSDMIQAVVEDTVPVVQQEESAENQTVDPFDTTLTSERDSSKTINDETYFPDETASTSSSEEFSDSRFENETLVETEVAVTEKRQRRVPDRYGYSNMCKNNEDLDEDSLTYEEVMSGPEREQWCNAMEEELKSFHENEAWEIVNKPSDAKVVQCRWVYKKKLNIDNTVRYRARLVAKGYTQREGIDYKETFSPVLKYSTLKLLFALSVKLDLNITHLDVTTAFLNGRLDETVYMELPQNFKCDSNQNEVLKLKRAIYGLKQSARAWNKEVDVCLQQLGYKKSLYEHCLYTKTTENCKTFLALFVDDFFLFSNCNKEVEYLKSELSKRFKLKDLGQLRQCLGMDIKIQKDCIFISQESFIDKLVSKFGLEKCKNVETPMEGNLKLQKGENSNSKFPYQQLIGSLMYLSILTRPDISYCISYLSQFNNYNTETHYKHAKRVLKYLYSTKSFGLKYVKNNSDLMGYADADWASDNLDRKSYTGYCFIYSNCIVSHESRKQQTVALSSTEAEYMAACEATKEAIHLRNLLHELTNRQNNVPVTIYTDSQSAQKLTENSVYHRRTKHIDVKFHFIREAVGKRYVKLEYLRSSEMPADLLTKSLSKIKHYYFVKKMGVVKLDK